METIFSLSGFLTLPFWFLMIFLPRWRWSLRIMKSLLPIVPALVAYVLLILPRFAQVLPLVMKPELPQIAALLGSPDGATIGWIHFLAFDLFVGRWVFLDSRERGLNAVLMAPVLFLVLMLGPLGLLLYLAVRFAAGASRQDPRGNDVTSQHS